jgi:hypothetical protein
VTYTPFVNFLGADSFDFVVSDRRLTSSPARVSLTVKPGLLINNVSLAEGNVGTRFADFVVVATAPVSHASFSYSTIDGTAKAGSDYEPAGGTIADFSIFVAGGGVGFGIP